MLNNKQQLETKLPKYEELKEDLRSKIGPLEKKKETFAREYIPKMFYMLYREYKLDWQDARDRVIEDAGAIGKWGFWTIQKFLPKEAKDQDRRFGGLVSAAKRKERGLAVTDPETRILVAKAGAKALIEEHLDQMQKIARISGELRTKVKALEEKLKKATEQAERSVVLPHDFSILNKDLNKIGKLIEQGVVRIDCRLVSPGKISILNQPKRIEIPTRRRQ